MRVVLALAGLMVLTAGLATTAHAWQSAVPQREARREAARQRSRELAIRDQLVAQAEDNYRQLQQAVRLLERIKDRDEELLSGALTETHRSQAELIIRRFYRDRPGEIEAKG